jgi:hypothetical protein
MSLTGGKRKVNKSLKAWVTFVKKVQREEKLSYKDAIHRAKVRKDKGEKWMAEGGQLLGGMPPRIAGGSGFAARPGFLADSSNKQRGGASSTMPIETTGEMEMVPLTTADTTSSPLVGEELENSAYGGRRRRRTMRRSRSRGRGRTARRARGRGRASRKH